MRSWIVLLVRKLDIINEGGREFFGEQSLCVTGFSAETAGLSVIKGWALKIELS